MMLIITIKNNKASRTSESNTHKLKEVLFFSIGFSMDLAFSAR